MSVLIESLATNASDHDADTGLAKATAVEAQRSFAAQPVVRDERSGLDRYFQQICTTPLLTIEEEVALARRIRRGDQAARDHMIRANLRLVVKIAMGYRHFGLPLPDLISEGNLGLIKAVERFDPAKGGKLSTYAAWWIRQSIKCALSTQGRTIRLPVYLVERIALMRCTALALTERFGREPTDEELAAELQMPTAKVAHLKSVSVHPASLDARIGEEENAWTFSEIVRDENAPNPCEQLQAKNLTRDLRTLLGALDAREAGILKLRFGLDGGEGRTLAEVGRCFGITHERSRQIEALALKKLRRAMARHEKVRSRAEVEIEERLRARMAVIREFSASRPRNSAPLKQPRHSGPVRAAGAIVAAGPLCSRAA